MVYASLPPYVGVHRVVYASLPPMVGIQGGICLPASHGGYTPLGICLPPCLPGYTPWYTMPAPCTPLVEYTLLARARASNGALGSRKRSSLGGPTSWRSGAKKCLSSYARALRVTPLPARE